MENNFAEKYMEEQEKGEAIMTEKVEIIGEVEQIEASGRYIPADELAESKRIMQGRTMYTINRDMEIVETHTVRCNHMKMDCTARLRFPLS